VGWLPRAIVSGLIAAVAMLLTFVLAYAAAYIIQQHTRIPLLSEWLYGLTHNGLTDLAGGNIYAVAGLHFLVALVWAGLYAYYAEPRLNGPGLVRGIQFSFLPWILSIVVLLPLTGGGLLGASLDAGPLPVLGNLVLHLVFGATLGALYGPLGDIPADSLARDASSDDLETTRRSELLTAEGILAGLAFGLLASIVAIALNTAPSVSVLGIPHAGFVLGTTLIAGAFGGLLGSFAGLTPPS
jgi:hypothetical protein